jgi:hypothetical protein
VIKPERYFTLTVIVGPGTDDCDDSSILGVDDAELEVHGSFLFLQPEDVLLYVGVQHLLADNSYVSTDSNLNNYTKGLALLDLMGVVNLIP